VPFWHGGAGLSFVALLWKNAGVWCKGICGVAANVEYRWHGDDSEAGSGRFEDAIWSFCKVYE